MFHTQRRVHNRGREAVKAHMSFMSGREGRFESCISAGSEGYMSYTPTLLAAPLELIFIVQLQQRKA